MFTAKTVIGSGSGLALCSWDLEFIGHDKILRALMHVVGTPNFGNP